MHTYVHKRRINIFILIAKAIPIIMILTLTYNICCQNYNPNNDNSQKVLASAQYLFKQKFNLLLINESSIFKHFLVIEKKNKN